MLSRGKRRIEHCIRLSFVLTSRENSRFWIISQNWRIVKARIAGSSSRRFENMSKLYPKTAPISPKNMPNTLTERFGNFDRLTTVSCLRDGLTALSFFCIALSKSPRRPRSAKLNRPNANWRISRKEREKHELYEGRFLCMG